MTIIKISTVMLALSLGAASATGQPLQQEGDSSKTAPSQSMPKGKMGMSGNHMMIMEMANEPHHVLAMAYQRNLATFATSLSKQETGASSVNVEFARAAVAEMRRSFDEMKQQHDAHMQTMSPEMRTKMSGMMKQMEPQQTQVSDSLTALEQEVQSSAPDPKKISALAASVSSHCDAMSKMHHGNMGSEMKMKM